MSKSAKNIKLERLSRSREERDFVLNVCALYYAVSLSSLAQELSSSKGNIDVDVSDDVKLIRSKHLKVLIVDDDSNFRKSLSFKLRRKYGAEAQEAESGITGIDRLKSGLTYDLVLLDIKMPIMSGVEAYHEMNKVKPGPHIVMMSAYSDSEEWNKAKELGVPLLSKPISDESLREILMWAK